MTWKNFLPESLTHPTKPWLSRCQAAQTPQTCCCFCAPHVAGLQTILNNITDISCCCCFVFIAPVSYLIAWLAFWSLSLGSNGMHICLTYPTRPSLFTISTNCPRVSWNFSNAKAGKMMAERSTPVTCTQKNTKAWETNSLQQGTTQLLCLLLDDFQRSTEISPQKCKGIDHEHCFPRSKTNFFCSACITQAVTVPPSAVAEEATLGNSISAATELIADITGGLLLGINPAPMASPKSPMCSAWPVASWNKSTTNYTVKSLQRMSHSSNTKESAYKSNQTS